MKENFITINQKLTKILQIVKMYEIWLIKLVKQGMTKHHIRCIENIDGNLRFTRTKIVN